MRQAHGPLAVAGGGDRGDTRQPPHRRVRGGAPVGASEHEQHRGGDGDGRDLGVRVGAADDGQRVEQMRMRVTDVQGARDEPVDRDAGRRHEEGQGEAPHPLLEGPQREGDDGRRDEGGVGEEGVGLGDLGARGAGQERADAGEDGVEASGAARGHQRAPGGEADKEDDGEEALHRAPGDLAASTAVDGLAVPGLPPRAGRGARSHRSAHRPPSRARLVPAWLRAPCDPAPEMPRACGRGQLAGAGTSVSATCLESIAPARGRGLWPACAVDEELVPAPLSWR